jgi:hypothetical protein
MLIQDLRRLVHERVLHGDPLAQALADKAAPALLGLAVRVVVSGPAGATDKNRPLCSTALCSLKKRSSTCSKMATHT